MQLSSYTAVLLIGAPDHFLVHSLVLLHIEVCVSCFCVSFCHINYRANFDFTRCSCVLICYYECPFYPVRYIHLINYYYDLHDTDHLGPVTSCS